MKATVEIIGRGIRHASEYLPIRNLSAAIATQANPKDYLGQLNSIYDYFVKHWRYVKDNAHKELVTVDPEAVFRLVIGGDGIGVGAGKGAGDCDCATVAIGSMLESIGFPIRIATTSGPNDNPGNLFRHVFPQAFVTGIGWVTVDPVLYPFQPFGAISKHSRIAYWDLNGRLLGHSGNVVNLHGIGGSEMSTINTYPDYSNLLGLASYDEAGEPDDWGTVGLANWGYLSPQMGIISAEMIPEIRVETSPDMNGLARTPMIELSPEDYKYIQVFKRPYDGMLGLTDEGEPVAYDGLNGFFKRMFKKVKKAVKKVGQRIKKGLKSVIRKLPGGKWLLKIAGKIRKVAMKIVRPLVKFVGKYASKLAPIAALIPGYGPAIAAGLHTAGKIAKLMNKWGVKTVGKKGKVRDLFSKNPKNIKNLQRELAEEAKKLKAQKRQKIVRR